MTDLTNAADWSYLAERLPRWREVIAELDGRLTADTHGDFTRWQTALQSLPIATPTHVALTDTITLTGTISRAETAALGAALKQLRPWRKGPWHLFGVDVDSEWRSDWKWRRVSPHLDDLRGRRVLDVGCGNGYFGWRMLDSGAELVAGVDPALLYCMQHLAVNHFLKDNRNWVVPLPFESLPVIEFDTVFSMGVIYHRRDPEDHARRLYDFTRPGGQVVVESLIVPEQPLRPNTFASKRYARMSNVWVIPTPELLTGWLEEAGFSEPIVVDITPTTVFEQRSTDWMVFESLPQALSPEDPARTVEGHPAPVRAVAIAHRR